MEALLGYEMVQVACGASHVLALSTERELFAWGRGDGGRLSTLFSPLVLPDSTSNHDLCPFIPTSHSLARFLLPLFSPIPFIYSCNKPLLHTYYVRTLSKMNKMLLLQVLMTYEGDFIRPAVFIVALSR